MRRTLLDLYSSWLLGVSLQFHPRDAWVGVYWEHVYEPEPAPNGAPAYTRKLIVYVCLLPFLPIRIVVRTGALR